MLLFQFWNNGRAGSADSASVVLFAEFFHVWATVGSNPVKLTVSAMPKNANPSEKVMLPLGHMNTALYRCVPGQYQFQLFMDTNLIDQSEVFIPEPKRYRLIFDTKICLVGEGFESVPKAGDSVWVRRLSSGCEHYFTEYILFVFDSAQCRYFYEFNSISGEKEQKNGTTTIESAWTRICRWDSCMYQVFPGGCTTEEMYSLGYKQKYINVQDRSCDWQFFETIFQPFCKK